MKNRRNMSPALKTLFFMGGFVLLANLFFAQEGLRPLTHNLNYIYSDLKVKPNNTQSYQSAKTTSANIELPFFDDFYYASQTNYPSQLFWTDSTCYVNTGMAIAPLSVGVATFDGLNKFGYPYTPNATFTSMQANNADTLTSREINLFTLNTQTLQPSDSIALIFYYQSAGNGDSPEVQDSLMVDFFKPKQNAWENRVWALRGNVNFSNTDSIFKRAFIWVTDTAFFYDGFKFRFRNKAGTNGNFDNWHIDYVYLDKNRSIIADTAWNDLSIAYVPSSFLRNYSAMPWHQYTGNQMTDKYSNFIRYNGTSTVNTTYSYEIYDNTNTVVNAASFGASNLPPFNPDGWQKNPVHSNPNLSYTFAPMTGETNYTIKHYMLNLAGDVNVGNDTVYQFQNFKNYFAYDDGSCETGYYVLGVGGRMAQKYQLTVPDSLRGIRIYFDPVGNLNTIQNLYKLKINVFTDIGSGPGVKLFTSDSIYPIYSADGHNNFTEYLFNTPFAMSASTYYIGIQQFVSAGITVGFDKNYDFSKNLYYDSGNGWTQSSYYGSLMMRPLFGEKVEPPVGIIKNSLANLHTLVYPNPAQDAFVIKLPQSLKKTSYVLCTMDGRLINQGEILSMQTTVSTQEIPSGMYMLLIKEKGTVIGRNKIIVQH